MVAERKTGTQAEAILSSEESGELERLEGTLRRNLRGCLEAARALLAIRNQRLYRARYRTFESYCQDRWSISHRHVNRWILWAEVVDSLGPRGPISDESTPERLPSETQSRPLSRIEPERRREAWDRAVDIAGGSQPSESQVREAVAQVRTTLAPSREEPTDVRRGRENGTIPIDAEVTIVEQDGEAPAEEESERDEGVSDEEWLETLPARKALSDEARRWFDADALAYRHLTPLRRRYRDETRPAIVAAKRAGKHVGPWITAHDRYLRQADPSRWIACGLCNGTGRMELVGKCAACRGHAYHISGVSVTPESN